MVLRRPELRLFAQYVLGVPGVKGTAGLQSRIVAAALDVIVGGKDRQQTLLQGLAQMYGDNVFEKDGIRRDRTGDGEKTRCLCGKRGIFNRDGPAMGPQIIRQLE